MQIVVLKSEEKRWKKFVVVTIFSNDESARPLTVLKTESTTDILFDQVDRCFRLSTQIYVQSAKLKSYWLIEMNISKTLQGSAFSFIVLNLTERAVLHFHWLMLDYIKSERSNWKFPTQSILKQNRGNTKNISFWFYYSTGS